MFSISVTGADVLDILVGLVISGISDEKYQKGW